IADNEVRTTKKPVKVKRITIRFRSKQGFEERDQENLGNSIEPSSLDQTSMAVTEKSSGIKIKINLSAVKRLYPEFSLSKNIRESYNKLTNSIPATRKRMDVNQNGYAPRGKRLKLTYEAPKNREECVEKSRDINKAMLKILRKLNKKDEYTMFQTPMSPKQTQHHPKISKNPISLEIMKKRVERGKYKQIEQFKADFVLMCKNSKRQSHPNRKYYEYIQRMLEFGRKLIKKEIEKQKLWVLDNDHTTEPIDVLKNEALVADTPHVNKIYKDCSFTEHSKQKPSISSKKVADGPSTKPTVLPDGSLDPSSIDLLSKHPNHYMYNNFFVDPLSKFYNSKHDSNRNNTTTPHIDLGPKHSSTLSNPLLSIVGDDLGLQYLISLRSFLGNSGDALPPILDTFFSKKSNELSKGAFEFVSAALDCLNPTSSPTSRSTPRKKVDFPEFGVSDLPALVSPEHTQQPFQSPSSNHSSHSQVCSTDSELTEFLSSCNHAHPSTPTSAPRCIIEDVPRTLSSISELLTQFSTSGDPDYKGLEVQLAKLACHLL
ncbi:Bromodomain-containing protein 9, partial [Zancudomyces culisetae]